MKEPITSQEGRKTRKIQIIVAMIGAVATLIVGVLGLMKRWAVDELDATVPTEVRITGRISNALTDEPIRKAEVSVEARGVPERTESDSKGVFTARLPTEYSTVRVRVTARGFKPYDELLSRDPANQIIAVTLEPEIRPTKPGAAAPPRDPGEWRVTRTDVGSPAKASFASLLNPSLPTVSGASGPWAIILFGDQERRDDITSAIRSTLNAGGHDTVSLFRRVADEQRLASDVFRGSSTLLQELGAARYCSNILAVKLSIVRLGTTEGITFAQATLSAHVVSPTGELLRTFELSEKGGGEDDSSARRRAVDELIDALPRELPGKID